MLQTSFYMLVDYIALGWPECDQQWSPEVAAAWRYMMGSCSSRLATTVHRPRGAGRLRA